MVRKVQRVLAALCLIAVFSVCALAQNSGSITGTVKDSGGGVIPGATVTVIDQARASRQTVTTSSEGNFAFPQLQPGTYTVTTEAKGFKKSESTDVTLPVATRISLGDIVLQVGSISDTITVEADAGTIQIQSESGERSNIVTNRQIRDIGLNGRKAETESAGPRGAVRVAVSAGRQRLVAEW